MHDVPSHRPATRVVHAGLPPAGQGEPFLPGPTFAAPYHLAGPADASLYGYGRYANPTFTAYEKALGELEGGEVTLFASGMAAVAAVLLPLLRPGDVLVAPSDAYPGVRTIAAEHLEPRGVEVRLVPTDETALREALPGARLVWVETPSNPGLDMLDLEALTGHSDLVLGHVAARDEQLVEDVRAWRNATGAVPGPFEAWLAHRSLATLDVRLARACANAEAVADLLRARGDVGDVRWPGLGSVVCFDVGSPERAQAFLAACELVAEATSFGGVHTSAERRARWGTDAVPAGFIRLSVGVEDIGDIAADLTRALDAAG
jgi:cystathionine gamma-lyase